MESYVWVGPGDATVVVVEGRVVGHMGGVTQAHFKERVGCEACTE